MHSFKFNYVNNDMQCVVPLKLQIRMTCNIISIIFNYKNIKYFIK